MWHFFTIYLRSRKYLIEIDKKKRKQNSSERRYSRQGIFNFEEISYFLPEFERRKMPLSDPMIDNTGSLSKFR